MWAALARFILRNRLAILSAFTLITIFFAYQASFVQITYEFTSLLPKEDSAAINYANFKKQFGEDGNVMVIGLDDTDIFELEKFNDWYDLTYDIKQVDGIQEVVSIARVFNLTANDSIEQFEFKPLISEKPHTQLQLDSIKAAIFNLPFYNGFLFNKESHATLMAITFDKYKLNTKTRLSIVDSIKVKTDVFEKKYKQTLHYSGLPYIRTNIARKIASEMVLFLGLAFLVTLVILSIFFRSFYPVIFSLLIIVIGVIWSFGTIYLLGYKISALSGLIPPLIIVIGIPNCILLLNKYHTEINKHGNKIKALSRMVEKIGISTFFANVTTSIGFGVFYFTHSQILVEFGLVTALNVMGTYLTSLFLIPIIFSYLPAPKEKQTSHLDGKRINSILTTIDYWVHHYRKRIYISVVVIILISVIGILKINIIGFVVDDLPKNDPIYVDLKYFETNYHGVLPFEITVDTRKKGAALSLTTLYKINKLQKELKKYDEFSKPVSVVEAIKFSYQAYKGGEPKYYILPNGLELGKMSSYFVNSKQKKQGMFKAFIDSNRQITRISVQMADVGSIRMKELVKEIRPKVDSIFDPAKYDVNLNGNSLMFLKGNNYLVKNLQESVLLAIFLISLVMITLFASFRMVVISVLPSIVPLIITAGLMGYFHIPLKPSTILIFSIAFGIASDGNMYFLTKYKQELRNHQFSISKTVSLTIRETGVSMIYTAIILFCGFGIFSASSFGGTAALGILISLTLLISYCSNLILLPCFLLSLEKNLTRKALTKESLFQLYDEDEDIELEHLEIKKTTKEE
ncbi:MAG: MMPL family transporter [Bacteroidetes bacterium]|nr:MMPL family transporter [Bacteroidota bacterium]MBK9800606.1 MMPL family transporter [Bacteroidota bacterium]MBP6411969.1 MMPL family transporter [Bacteroidia bacterium]